MRTIHPISVNTDRLSTGQASVLPQAIEHAAQRFAEQIALRDNEQTLTFQGLNARANQLARVLLDKGVSSGDRVGVYLNRSVDTYVALLAVLKLGAAYVPLEASLPDERLKAVAKQAQFSLVICQQPYLRLAKKLANKVCNLDEPALISHHSEDNLAIAVAPDQMAYIIFTSGSTGQPKGVAVTHGSVMAVLAAMHQIDGIEEQDCWLSLATLAFDISVVETFYPLVFGGSVVIGQKDWIFSPQRIHHAIKQHGVTIIQQTPSAWKLMMSAGWPEQLKIKMICCGEALTVGQTRALLENATRLWNFYGPTEATVYACYHEVDKQQLDVADAAAAVPIGRALPGYDLYVLDEQLRPTESGNIGNLYIGGPGVAQQYWQNPVQTADNFLPDPFSGTSGQRIYHTHDRVRQDEYGQLIYVSRSDNQVKIHGYRVELGDIESTLMQHDSVVLTVAQTIENAGGEKQLVAYVELCEGAAIDATQLREYLRGELPYYMVPGAIEILDAIPLTASGKVDKKSLPAPTWVASQRDIVAPQGELEKQLLRAWQSVLGRTDFGVCESFFELGGHSLMAITLIKAISEHTQCQISFLDIIRYANIRTLAERIASMSSAEEPQSEALQHTLTPDPAQRFSPFPLSPIQQAYWIGSTGGMALGSAGCYNYLEVDLPNVCHENLQQAVNQLIIRHDMLRVVFTPDGQQRVMPSCEPYEVKFYPLASVSNTAREEALTQIANEMTFKDGEFDQNRIFDVRLSQLTNSQYRLHTMLNIMVLDATSMHIFFSELAKLLEAPQAPLAELDVTFRDYILAERALLDHPMVTKSKAYWQSRLDSLPAAPNLPLVKEPSKVENPFFSRRMFTVAKPAWRALQDISAHQGITPSVLLLSTFSDVLSQWSQSSEFTLNLTLFNRHDLHAQVDSMIGDFTSVNLLAAAPDMSKSFAERARIIQQQLWSDLEHKHYSGIEVLRDLNQRSGGREQRLMPVVFNSELGLNQVSETSTIATLLSDRRYGISQTPQVWLDMGVFEVDGELVVTLDALDEIFPCGMLDDLLAAYREMLAWLTDDAAHWLQVKRPALPASQQQVRDEVNSVKMPLPTQLLHQTFEERAHVNPEATALISSERVIRYGELNQAANLVAGQLTQHGVAVNELVAVVMNRSWQQVVAVLAILKSGGAYLPIQADFPQSRIEMLLQQSGARQIVTEPGVQLPAQWQQEYHVTYVEDAALKQTGLSDPEPQQQLNDLAYVIFTSGSTGQPKGVAIDHLGAANTINSINDKFNVNERDTVLALSSLNFDLSVYDIFGLLAVGGQLVIPDAALDKDPAHWHQLIQTYHVTLWNTVPALMQMYVDHLDHVSLSSDVPIRQVMMSGDWIPVSLPERIRTHMPAASIESMGGATEASIWSIAYQIDEVESNWKSIPYGKPLANQTYHVLNADLAPCPNWVTGELYIGGIGLAQCYWGNKEKTDSHFIRHPDSGERLYRTGDLGRYFPDGNIEFLGREDNQVKIQGYRIELGEIEAAINQHPQIKESLVIAHAVADKTTQGNKILAAYLVWNGNEEHTAESSEKSLEKTRFKLQREGLRHDLSDVQGVSLRPLSTAHLAQHLGYGLTYRESSIDLNAVSNLLCSLSEIRQLDTPLPKYFYASSGGLNPIQAYLSVSEGSVPGLAPGVYYYDPVQHQLQIVQSDISAVHAQPEGVARLLLVGRRAAIEPAYGQYAEYLCRVEVGYIQDLLDLTAHANELAIQEREGGNEAVLSLIGCSTDDWLLKSLDIGVASPSSLSAPVSAAEASGITLPLPTLPAHFSLQLLERQSYRQFQDAQISLETLSNLLTSMPECAHPDTRVYLGLKANAVDELGAGFYQYDRAAHQLSLVRLSDNIGDGLYGGDNEQTFEACSFAIYVVGASHHTQALSDAGRVGQRLSAVGVKLALGMCAIGGFNQQPIEQQLGLQPGHQILHCLLGGAIHIEQTLSWMQAPQPVQSEDFGALKQSLQEALPEYMVPSVFTTLQALPLTANGKVDRKRLPAPDFEQQQETSYTPPGNAIQSALVEVWQQTLSLQKVGIHDHFFELGGSSVQLVSTRHKIKQQLNMDIDVASLFRYSTIDSLAEHLQSQQGQTASQTADSAANKHKNKAQRHKAMAQKARQGQRRTKRLKDTAK